MIASLAILASFFSKAVRSAAVAFLIFVSKSALSWPLKLWLPIPICHPLEGYVYGSNNPILYFLSMPENIFDQVSKCLMETVRFNWSKTLLRIRNILLSPSFLNCLGFMTRKE